MAKLRRIRRQKEITIAGLAELASVSDETIRKIERGGFGGKFHHRVRVNLAYALQVPVSTLFSKEGKVK